MKVRVRIRVDDSPAVLTLPTHIQGLKSADMVQYGVPALLKKNAKGVPALRRLWFNMVEMEIFNFHAEIIFVKYTWLQGLCLMRLSTDGSQTSVI